MKRPETWELVMFISTLIITLGFSLASMNSLAKENKRLKRDLTYFESTYIRKQGWTVLWSGAKNGVNYDLRSFDGGKTWYAVHQGKDDTLIIDGFAESVYPGLMKTLQDWDAIEKYATEHGPINPNNPADLNMLLQHGLSVTPKTN